MLLITLLSILTLAAAKSCPTNPTNPQCPIWLQSNVTEAYFDIDQRQAFTVRPTGGEPLIALASNVNVYFGYDGNLIM